jgi:hypothetical protein
MLFKDIFPLFRARGERDNILKNFKCYIGNADTLNR